MKNNITKFNPTNAERLTYSECLSPAMKITDEEDARQYLSDYVAFIQKTLYPELTNDKITAEKIAKNNLAYFAGYYGNETRERIERLFHCIHPVFGEIKDTGPISKEKAYDTGLKDG